MRLPAAPALVSFFAVIGGGMIVGEVFPFSRFSMYADIAPRGQGAAPVFLADGRIEPIERFDRFAGLDPGAFGQPAGIPSTLDYRIHEMRAWVQGRAGDGGCGVRAELGFVVFTRGEGGRVAQELRVQTRGTACRR